MGSRARRDRDAERRRRGGRGARRAAGRRAGHDVHGLAGPAFDDPGHVQDRGRADADGDARRRADHRHPRAVDLRRSQRRDGVRGRPGSRCSASSSVQEAHDLALISHAATLEARVPFLHFFDGFRTSHEVDKIETLDRTRPARDDRRPADAGPSCTGTRPRPSRPPRIRAEPRRVLPGTRGGNPFYDAVPDIVQQTMDRLAARSGRPYRLFDYVGDPAAERVLVLMGSGCGAVEEAVEELIRRGEKVGMVKVRLYRPFSARPSSRPCRPRCARSASSIARRNPARRESRSTRTS